MIKRGNSSCMPVELAEYLDAVKKVDESPDDYHRRAEMLAARAVYSSSINDQAEADMAVQERLALLKLINNDAISSAERKLLAVGEGPHSSRLKQLLKLRAAELGKGEATGLQEKLKAESDFELALADVALDPAAETPCRSNAQAFAKAHSLWHRIKQSGGSDQSAMAEMGAHMAATAETMAPGLAAHAASYNASIAAARHDAELKEKLKQMQRILRILFVMSICSMIMSFGLIALRYICQ